MHSRHTLLIAALLALAGCVTLPAPPAATCSTDTECEALDGRPVSLDAR
jgi:hypothetical protein